MTENPQTASGTNILVVDDDQDFRWAMSNVLESAGYQVCEAENGRAALKTLEKDIPNLILLDYRMPRRDRIAGCAENTKRSSGSSHYHDYRSRRRGIRR